MITSHSLSSLAAPSAVLRGAALDPVDSVARAAGVSRDAKAAIVDGDVDHVRQGTRVADTFDATIAAVEESKEAREESSGWNTLGTLFLGPLVGTAIGTAIGNSANPPSDDDATRAGIHLGIRYRDDDDD